MINSNTQDLREFFLAGREELLNCNPASRPGAEWMEAYSALVDETLRRIYALAWQAARASFNFPEEPHDGEKPIDTRFDHGVELALLALGGYGRREMCPFSDIDIAFVPGEEENPLLDAVIKEAFRLIVEVLIDGARLEVGYAYRPLSDCATLDHTAKAALLESRLIAGSERLRHSLREELHFKWDAVDFLLSQAAGRRAVAKRLSSSLYSVEPNVKEGTGTLRDIHTALWTAGALHPCDSPMKDLEWRGVITRDDAQRALAANEFFLKLRVWLHLKTGRKTDTLLLELQDKCARDWGYTGAGARASQDLLGDFYVHAENALRFSEKVRRSLLEGPLRLDDHFVATSQRLDAAHPYVLRNHPELLLTPFALVHKYGFPTSARLDFQIEEALQLVNSTVRRNPIMRASFLSVLDNVGEAADALQQLRARGLLQKLIPEFDLMLRLAPADPMHELTVGEHSIYAVRQLGELWRARIDDEFLYALWDGVDDTELLVLATLLHDVGKIEPSGDHAINGERMVRDIAQRLDLREERICRLQLLVRRHLLLPRASRLRELSAPGTIRDVVEHVGDVPNLKMLYLLSLADTRAVSERAYSPSELGELRELYERVLIAMTREEAAQVLTDSEAREEMVQRERQRLRREMRHLDLSEGTLQKLCDNLPASYVLNTPLPTIATHLRLLDQLPQEKLIVDFYNHARDAFSEMTVITYDDAEPGLLSKICGAVYALGMEIRMAQVFTLSDWRGDSGPLSPEESSARKAENGESMSTESATAESATAESATASTRSVRKAGTTPKNIESATPKSDAKTKEGDAKTEEKTDAPRNIVLDRLHVSRGARPLSTSQGAKLAAALREVLVDGKSLDEIFAANGKTVPTGVTPQRISVRNDLSDEHSVLTLVNENVPGLMFHITRTLANMKWDIHSAKVTTWAGRAEDAFYVTRRLKNKPDDGTIRHQKIDDDDIKTELERLQRRLRRTN